MESKVRLQQKEKSLHKSIQGAFGEALPETTEEIRTHYTVIIQSLLLGPGYRPGKDGAMSQTLLSSNSHVIGLQQVSLLLCLNILFPPNRVVT